MPSPKLDFRALWAEVSDECDEPPSWLLSDSDVLTRWLEAIKFFDEFGTESLLVPDPNDFWGLLRYGRETAEFHRRHLRDSYSAEPGYAVRDEDDEDPRRSKIIFRTKDGVETCYRGLPAAPADASPGSDPGSGQAHSVCAPPQASLSPEDSWDVLINANASASSRIAAFGHLRDGPFAAKAIEQLAKEIIDLDVADAAAREWRDAIVFSAEDNHFPAELREAVGDGLLRIASGMRQQSAGEEKVVWAALRRGASLLPTSNAGRLLEFLAPGGSVDTRAVALQCISRLFEREPPTQAPHDVADRVHKFAERFLDPDVFMPGEPSLIARNAVSALAALGDRRLGNALRGVQELGRPWMRRRVMDELSRIRLGWERQGIPEEHPALANLAHALDRID